MTGKRRDEIVADTLRTKRDAEEADRAWQSELDAQNIDRWSPAANRGDKLRHLFHLKREADDAMHRACEELRRHDRMESQRLDEIEGLVQ